MATCQFIVKREANGDVQYCISEVPDDTSYCPIHANGTPQPTPRRRVARDLSHDILPWDEHDEQIFAAQPRAKGRR
jgi:hypothetical protein